LDEHHGERRGRKRRNRHVPRGTAQHPHHRTIRMTEEGFPAAAEDAPRPSPPVEVSAESRERYPWLPPRVIAGSVWRGPGHERVRVDESGAAAPWRSGPRGRAARLFATS
jgi:hypothetical protein